MYVYGLYSFIVSARELPHYAIDCYVISNTTVSSICIPSNVNTSSIGFNTMILQNV